MKNFKWKFSSESERGAQFVDNSVVRFEVYKSLQVKLQVKGSLKGNFEVKVKVLSESECFKYMFESESFKWKWMFQV